MPPKKSVSQVAVSKQPGNSSENLEMATNVESPPSQLTKENVNRLDTNSDRRNSNSSVGSEAYSVNSGIQYSKGSRPSTASSSEPSSSEPSSRQSLEPSSIGQPVITPDPIPNSDDIYNLKISKKVQGYKDSINEYTVKPITGSTRDSAPNNYLFVFLGNNLINFFESTSNFELGATFSYSNKNYLPNNYISKKMILKVYFKLVKRSL